MLVSTGLDNGNIQFYKNGLLDTLEYCKESISPVCHVRYSPL